MSVKTNIRNEFKEVVEKEGVTLKVVAERYGMFPSNLSRLLANNMPTERLISIMDMIGYDVEVRFVKKEEERSA